MQINHTLYEGNRSADWLANFSIHVDHLNLIVLETSTNFKSSSLMIFSEPECLEMSGTFCSFFSLGFCPLLYQEKKRFGLVITYSLRPKIQVKIDK